MLRIAGVTMLASAFALTACGGGGKSQSATAPVAKPSTGTGGGLVTAEPSKGVLGPALIITPQGGLQVTGKTAPISPKENRPTDAQSHGVAGVAACTSTSANPAPANLAKMNAAILCLLNGERSSHGLPPLHSNSSLVRAAKGWANTMVANRFFAHESGGSSPLTRIKRTGYVRGSWEIGENIAWGSGVLATPRAIVNGWMHSPPHRANILHGAFRDIGVAIKLGAPGAGLSGGATYVTDFGKH
jgi:uncharacterized protein YkwD